MNHVLHNPVYYALLSGDAHLSFGSGPVRCFDEAVSPFAGFPEEYDNGFEDLYYLLTPERTILYATPDLVDEPKGWKLLKEIKGLQFVFTGKIFPFNPSIKPIPLNHQHVEQMIQLATLTKPGPFGIRTIEFGHYYGIFDNKHLVAMTGQRLHPFIYTEISAVCTHPDYLGKGFAATLMQHQINIILGSGQTPFLHVREDNGRAIALYHRLGFEISRPMNFYFLQRKSTK